MLEVEHHIELLILVFLDEFHRGLGSHHGRFADCHAVIFIEHLSELTEIFLKMRSALVMFNTRSKTFSGPAWKYNEDLNQYYLHLFAEGQPDLNMDNPKVREEIKDIMRFWLDMGVDGFREDVITFISKAEGLPNGFPLPVAILPSRQK